jgi:hypothetical protein
MSKNSIVSCVWTFLMFFLNSRRWFMACLDYISHLVLVLVLKVVVTVVQRIMTEFNGAVSEEAKIVTI